MTKADVSPIVQRTLRLTDFYIEEKLLGRAHTFGYESIDTTIRLPSKSEIARTKDDIYLSVGRLSSHRTGPRGGTRDATYEIWRVNASVRMREGFQVPHNLLPGTKTPYHAMSVNEQERLHGATKSYGGPLGRAFQYWLRVLRWQTGRGLLGRGATDDFDRTEDAHVVDPRTGKTFGYGYGHMVVPATQLVSNLDWNKAHKLLKASAEPPVWIGWLLDGERAEVGGNYQSAVANYAIACESFLISSFLAQFPNALHPDAQRVLESQVYGRAVLDKFVTSERFPGVKRNKGVLQKLLDDRNKIMHRGSSAALAREESKKYRAAVHSLIYDGARP